MTTHLTASAIAAPARQADGGPRNTETALRARGLHRAPGNPRAALRVVAALVAPLIVALAVLGGVGSYATVRQAAAPYFGDLAWIVPIGLDVGIVILLAWDLLMEYLDMAWPVLRWVAWGYIGGTVTVNVIAAHGDVQAA
jgi:hypothetical protein